MERERKRSTPSKTIEKDTLVEKFRWKNGGGSARLTIDGTKRIIKPGEVFYAKEEDIPAAFRNTIRPLEAIVHKEPAPVKKAVTPKYRVVPSIESKEEEELFDVINSRGKKMNEVPLDKETAEEYKSNLEQ